LFSISDSSLNLTALRAIRLLRPLRTITAIKGLRRLVEQFLRSIPLLLSALLLCLVIYVFFGILGVQLMMGKYHSRCLEISTGRMDDSDRLCGYRECPTNWVCVEADSNPDWGMLSLDHLPAALLTIFTMTTLEGWSRITYMGMDALHPVVAIYFVVVVGVAALVVVNIALAILKSNIRPEEREDKKAALGTVRAPEEILNERAQRRRRRCAFFFRLSHKPAFEFFFLFAILLNTICMSVQYYGQPQSMTDALGTYIIVHFTHVITDVTIIVK
jgi:hypothetical protein